MWIRRFTYESSPQAYIIARSDDFNPLSSPDHSPPATARHGTTTTEGHLSCSSSLRATRQSSRHLPVRIQALWLRTSPPLGRLSHG